MSAGGVAGLPCRLAGLGGLPARAARRACLPRHCHLTFSCSCALSHPAPAELHCYVSPILHQIRCSTSRIEAEQWVHANGGCGWIALQARWAPGGVGAGPSRAVGRTSPNPTSNTHIAPLHQTPAAPPPAKQMGMGKTACAVGAIQMNPPPEGWRANRKWQSPRFRDHLCELLPWIDGWGGGDVCVECACVHAGLLGGPWGARAPTACTAKHVHTCNCTAKDVHAYWPTLHACSAPLPTRPPAASVVNNAPHGGTLIAMPNSLIDQWWAPGARLACLHVVVS